MKVEIKVLGGGCANCDKLLENAKLAAEELGIEAEFVKVSDKVEIAMAGVMSTPAVVIDEQLMHSGSIPSQSMIREWLLSQ